MRRDTFLPLILCALGLLLILLPGCETDTVTTPPKVDGVGITTPIGTKDEIIAGAAGDIKTANQDNPAPASRSAIDHGVSRIEAVLATAPAAVSIAQINAVVAQHNALVDRYAALASEFQAYKAQATKDAYMAVVKGFGAAGVAVTLAGLGIFLWSSYKRAGLLMMLAGPVIGGSGLLWGKPWFSALVAIAGVLIGAAIGLRHVWSVLDKDGNGRPDFLEKPAPPAASA